MATKQKSKTWKDIGKSKSSKKAPLSFEAKFRKFAIFCKIGGFVLLLAALGFGAYKAVQLGFVDDILYNKNQVAKKLFLDNPDGKISPKWIREYLGIKKATPIDKIDLLGLKKKIENVNQVSSAKVERVYPDQIKICITEKKPIAKVNTNNGVLLMSANGEFFEPICYAVEEIDAFVELTGIKILKQGKKYVAYPMAKTVNELFAETKKMLPAVFNTYQRVDLSDLHSKVSPLLEVYTNEDVKIIFLATDFNRQLSKLEYVLRYAKDKSVRGAQIDLSLEGRTDMKLRK